MKIPSLWWVKMVFLIATGTLLFTSCDQSFNPKGEFSEQMVVYSILSNDRTVQYVVVNKTYDPPEFDPLEVRSDNSIAGASVLITEPETAVAFHETLLVRTDTSRYSFPIRCQVLFPYQPQRGIPLTLDVSSALGSASGTMTMPTAASISFTGRSVLNSPSDFKNTVPISVDIVFSDLTKGYVIKMYVDYEVEISGSWQQERVEVPTFVQDTITYSLDGARYPSLTRRFSRGTYVDYVNAAYKAVLIQRYLRYQPNRLKFLRVVFTAQQLERHFYNYYSITNGFRDSHSIRLDLPLYSNMTGAHGLFGGYTIDSTIHILPATFAYNR